ncbi:ECF RNA polymerase sigma factor EcfG [Defluviimonas aquaemixtae]|uniref:ECF RNA polymerase sigma factor EcfG n=1 Tax=Albidovulum aquaemixtae TaxID=1542388 RepID=A0A2R8B597_9RHOB|nr:RNA polymerase sigma factor [Defluviimonas aquaemixtae]SPH17730.1 ECF RNA polymerase sigma factor EcfG [Defluviimonas aquaemixtae]
MPRSNRHGPNAVPAPAPLVTLIPDLRRLARRLVRDPEAAEDLVQEALLRVWSQMASGSGIEDLKPYLMTAARNIARRPPRKALPLSDAPEPSAPPEAPRRLVLREVAAALSRLPAAEQRLILRHVAGGESYAEMARAEDLPIGTVMSRLARGRARLRADCGLPERGPAAALLAGEDAA